MWNSYSKVLLLLCWSTRFSVEQEKCSDTGIWGEWGTWSSCPSGSTNALNFKWRKRYCLKQPPNCVMISQYTCLGTYTQLKECKVEVASTTGINAATTISANFTISATPLPPNVTVSTMLSSGNLTAPTTAPQLNNITASMTQLPAANYTVQATLPHATYVTASTTSPTTTKAEVPITAPPTAFPGSPCTICPVLTPAYLETAEGKDGKLLLDHYTDEAGCKNVRVQCASETNSGRAAIIFNGNILNPFAIAFGVVQVILQCNTETQWTYANETLFVLTVSCIVLPAESVTIESTATTTPLISTTSIAPSCMNCGSLSVGWVKKDSLMTNGMVVMDHSRANGCDVLLVGCSSQRSGAAVDVLDSTGLPLAAGVGIVNVTFSCGDNAKWLFFGGQEVTQILCVTPKAVTATVAPVTTPIIPSSAASAISSAATTAVTATVDRSTIVSPVTTSIPTAVTIDLNASCRLCPNLKPLAIPNNAAIEANGNLAIQHFYGIDGCREAEVFCSGDATDIAVVSFNGDFQNIVVSALNKISLLLICTENATWSRDGIIENVNSVTCALTATMNITISPSPSTPLRSTTVMLPDTAACARCVMPTIGNVSMAGFKQGNIITDEEEINGCLHIEISCINDASTLFVMILSMANETLASGDGSANITLKCNNASEWQTVNGTVVAGIICAAEAAADVATSIETTNAAEITMGTKNIAGFTTTQPVTSVSDYITAAATIFPENCRGWQWNEWGSWSECSDTCGACGSRQRFRGCFKLDIGCECSGSSYEKVVCNTFVCTYPRMSCCDGYTIGSSDNQFTCIPLISTRIGLSP